MSLQWATKVFLRADTEISEKGKFFTLKPITRKQREILGWTIKGEKAVKHRGTNVSFYTGTGNPSTLCLWEFSHFARFDKMLY